MVTPIKVLVTVTDITSSSKGWWLVERRLRAGKDQEPQIKQKENTTLYTLIRNSFVKTERTNFLLNFLFTTVYFVTELLIWLFLVISVIVANVVSTRKKKHQNIRLISQLNESSNDFIIGNNINADVIENETVEPQTTGGFVGDLVRPIVGENSAGHSQVI